MNLQKGMLEQIGERGDVGGVGGRERRSEGKGVERREGGVS